MRGGPRIAPVKTIAAGVQAACHAIQLTHDKADVRGAAGRHRGDDACASPDDTQLFLLWSHRKARFVRKVNQRQMKNICLIMLILNKTTKIKIKIDLTFFIN